MPGFREIAAFHGPKNFGDADDHRIGFVGKGRGIALAGAGHGSVLVETVSVETQYGTAESARIMKIS